MRLCGVLCMFVYVVSVIGKNMVLLIMMSFNCLLMLISRISSGISVSVGSCCSRLKVGCR